MRRKYPKGITRVTKNGIKVRSGYELKIMDQNPDLIYEPTMFQYMLNYVPDYLLITRTGKQLYIESKGRLTTTDRTKLKAVKRNNPTMDLRLLFENAEKKLTRSPKSQTYWKWAEVNGFKWAVGTEVPHNWRME